MRLLLLVLAVTVALTFTATASARRPANCGRLAPRWELKCARYQLHHARAQLRHSTTAHSPGYWRWRCKVAHRWIVSARYRLAFAARFTPNPGAAAYWTHRYFGYGWQADLMLCIANRESRYTLGATHQNYPTQYGVDYGPWQVNQPSHPWVNFYRIVRSWKYAAAVSWHLSGYGTDFSPWGGRC